jgi:hypothetical protein
MHKKQIICNQKSWMPTFAGMMWRGRWPSGTVYGAKSGLLDCFDLHPVSRVQDSQ